MSFPTTGILDNFNRADGGLGANWTYGNIEGDADGAPKVVSNTCRAIAGGASLSTAYWNPSTFGPDMEAYFTLGGDVTNLVFGVVLRCNGATSGNYYLISANGGTNFNIYRTDGGSVTNLNQVIRSFSTGDKLGAQIIGSTIYGYHYSGGTWNQIISATDTTYSGAGYAGVYMVDLSSDNSVFIDDFGGGTVVQSPNIKSNFFSMF